MSNGTGLHSGPATRSDALASDGEETDDRPGLRERKKERNRERLKEAAFELFAERGFDQVTVEEIADHADVSKSTLFRYFETKEDLLLVDHRMHRDALLAELASRPSDEPVLTSLRASLQSLAADYEADRARAVTLSRIMAESPALATRSLERQVAWEDGLAAAILPRIAARSNAQTRAAVLAAASVGVVRVATRRWIAADDDSRMIDHVVDALDLLIDELEGESLRRSDRRDR